MDEYRRKPRLPLWFDKSSELLKPSWRSIVKTGWSVILFAVFYIVTIVSIVLFLLGYTALRNLLNKYLGLYVLSWPLFNHCHCFNIFIIVWIPTLNIILYRLLMAYFDTIGNDTVMDYSKKRWLARGGFRSPVLAAVIAVFGCFNVGLACSLGQVCAHVLGDVGFELDIFGVDGIPCVAGSSSRTLAMSLPQGRRLARLGDLPLPFPGTLLDCASWGCYAAVGGCSSWHLEGAMNLSQVHQHFRSTNPIQQRRLRMKPVMAINTSELDRLIDGPGAAKIADEANDGNRAQRQAEDAQGEHNTDRRREQFRLPPVL